MQDQSALEVVKRYGGYRPASRATGVPESTLRRRVQSYTQRTSESQSISYRPTAPFLGATPVRQTVDESSESRVLSEQESLKLENQMLRGALRTRTRQQDGIIRAVENVFLNEPVPVIHIPSHSGRQNDECDHMGPYEKKPNHYPVLLLSDLQIGKVTPSYNVEVARDRIRDYAERAVRVLDVMSAGVNIPYVEVWLLGDMVEGESIFPNQPYHIETGVGAQACRIAPAIIAEFILSFAAAGYQVKVRAVKGNHGRDGSMRDAHHDSTNWDTVTYEVCRLMTAHGNIPSDMRQRVSWVVIEDYFYHVARMPGGWGVMLTHLDMIKGGGTSGTYEAKVMKWMQSIKEPFDYVVGGHFHRPINWPCGNVELIVNGTTEEPEGSFVQGVIAGTHRACQRMLVFHEDHGLIDDKKFYLDEHLPRT